MFKNHNLTNYIFGSTRIRNIQDKVCSKENQYHLNTFGSTLFFGSHRTRPCTAPEPSRPVSLRSPRDQRNEETKNKEGEEEGEREGRQR